MKRKLSFSQLLSLNVLFLLVLLAVYFFSGIILTLKVTVRAETPGSEPMQIFWDTGSGFAENQSAVRPRLPNGQFEFLVPARDLKNLRLDPCGCAGTITIDRIEISRVTALKSWHAGEGFSGWLPANNISSQAVKDGKLEIVSSGNDPFIVQHDLSGLGLITKALRGGLSVIAAFFTALIAFFLMPRREASQSSLAGPAILLATLALCLPLGYYIYTKAATHMAPVFQGEEGVYALSFVNSDGATLSKQRGQLKLKLDPFTIYRNLPSQQSDNYSIDENGFRGGINPAKTEKVFVLGGSAAFGQGLGSDEDTFSKILDKSYEKASVINAGVVGFLSGQELAYMVHYLDAYNPAGYVVFDGWNELFDQYISRRRKPGQLGFNNTFFMIEERLGELAREKGEFAAPGAISSREFASDGDYIAAITANYLANLEKMNAFAKSRGAFFLVVFQPEVSFKKTRSAAEQKNLDEWDRQYKYASSGFPGRYAELIKNVEAALGLKSVATLNLRTDARLNESTDELYFDVVHLNAAGHRLAAESILTKLP